MTPVKKVTPAVSRAPEVDRSVWYKTVEYPSKAGEKFSLQAAIEATLAKTGADWSQRRQKLSKDEELVLNEYQMVKGGGVAARLMLFTKDVAVETGKLVPGSTTVMTSFIEAKAGDEVCNSTCIFLVRGNHVVMVTSRAIKWVVLTNFLNHWMSEHGTVSFRFALVDGGSDAIRKKLHNVHRVEIIAGLSDDGDDETPRKLGKFERLVRRTSERLVDLGVTPGAGLSIKDVIAARSLRARLVLETEGQRSDDAMMRDLAIALQGQEDVRYVVSFGNRGKLTNEDITVTDILSLPSHKGHPQFIATVPRLLAWLNDAIKSGRVASTED